MALTPHKADPNYDEQMKLVASGEYNSGAAAVVTDPLVNRVMVMAAAHFGLTPFETGRIGNIAKKHLDAAGGDTANLNVEAMRADIAKLLKVSL